MRREAAAALAAMALLAGPARAQEGYLNLFLYEKSYAGIGTPTVIGAPAYYAAVAEPPLLAEAQFVDHIALHRGLNLQEMREGLGGAGWNWYVTSQFRLRALNVSSGPIRSPSFMPKFTIQWLRSSGGAADSPTSGMRWITDLHFVIGHHSNGGATCEFTDEDPSNDCAVRSPPAAPPGAREAWVDGGNFSTNYVETGGYVRRGRLSDDPNVHWLWAVDAGLVYQYHQDLIGFPLPGGAKGDFAALYGRNRVRIDVAAHRVLAKAAAVRAWMRTDLFHPEARRFVGARDYTLEAELLLQRVEGLREVPRWVQRIPTFVGLGVRWVRGEDYYNTQYARDINLVQLFVAADVWSPWAGN